MGWPKWFKKYQRLNAVIMLFSLILLVLIWQIPTKDLLDQLKGVISIFVANALLLMLGYDYFKRRETLKASSTEVKEVCKKIDAILLQYNMVVFPNAFRLHMIFMFIADYYEREWAKSVENSRLTIIDGYVRSVNTTPKLDELHSDSLIGYRDYIAGVIHGISRLLLTMQVLKQSAVEKYNRQNESAEDYISDLVWTAKQGIKTFEMIEWSVNSLRALTHEMNHNMYTWDEFVIELGKLEDQFLERAKTTLGNDMKHLVKSVPVKAR